MGALVHRRTRLTCHCEERSDVAILGRHLQFVQGVDKTHGPIAPVAAVSDRPVGEHSTAWGLWCTTTLPDVSLRGAKRRGNLGKAVTISPMAFPRCGRVRRDCTPRALPRAARSGRHVGLRPPRNDKSGAFPFYRFPVRIGSLPPGGACPSPTTAGSGRQCLPEIATGAKRPRNDKPLAFTILTIACLLCRCAAGRGVPLPYNVPSTAVP